MIKALLLASVLAIPAVVVTSSSDATDIEAQHLSDATRPSLQFEIALKEFPANDFLERVVGSSAVSQQSGSQTPRELAWAFYDGLISLNYSPWDACNEMQDQMNNEIAAMVSFYVCPSEVVTEAQASLNFAYLDEFGEAVITLIRSRCGREADLKGFWIAMDEEC